MRKYEVLTITLVLLAVAFLTFVNLQLSFRRSRDNQRKNDVRSVSNALNLYLDDFGFLPASGDGRIVACLGPENKLIPCQWGADQLRDVGDLSYTPYLDPIPQDPEAGLGASCYYLATEKNYQIFASLEGLDEAEYDPKIRGRDLPCGSRICNFGLASGNIPLDKSLEEYENNINAQRKKLSPK